MSKVELRAYDWLSEVFHHNFQYMKIKKEDHDKTYIIYSSDKKELSVDIKDINPFESATLLSTFNISEWSGFYDNTAWHDIPEEVQESFRLRDYYPEKWAGIKIFEHDYVRCIVNDDIKLGDEHYIYRTIPCGEFIGFIIKEGGRFRVKPLDEGEGSFSLDKALATGDLSIFVIGTTFKHTEHSIQVKERLFNKVHKLFNDPKTDDELNQKYLMLINDLEDFLL